MLEWLGNLTVFRVIGLIGVFFGLLGVILPGVVIGSILLGDARMANKVKAAIEGKRDFSVLLGGSLDVESVIRAL